MKYVSLWHNHFFYYSSTPTTSWIWNFSVFYLDTFTNGRRFCYHVSLIAFLVRVKLENYMLLLLLIALEMQNKIVKCINQNVCKLYDECTSVHKWRLHLTVIRMIVHIKSHLLFILTVYYKWWNNVNCHKLGAPCK